ncbi:MAG: hypothetical protein IM555_10960, partial [Microcystis sp. M55BS1]
MSKIKLLDAFDENSQQKYSDYLGSTEAIVQRCPKFFDYVGHRCFWTEVYEFIDLFAVVFGNFCSAIDMACLSLPEAIRNAGNIHRY